MTARAGSEATPTTTRFACPRCSNSVEEEFYGPCTACRIELRASVGGEAHEVAPVEYEPKMNVTPNAVAMKDD